MAKKNARKSGAARMAVVEDELDDATNGMAQHSTESHSDAEPTAAKPSRKGKSTADHQSSGNFGVSDIKKAAAFANSIGGLEKAIAVLQILKVAKEVQ